MLIVSANRYSFTRIDHIEGSYRRALTDISIKSLPALTPTMRSLTGTCIDCRARASNDRKLIQEVLSAPDSRRPVWSLALKKMVPSGLHEWRIYKVNGLNHDMCVLHSFGGIPSRRDFRKVNTHSVVLPKTRRHIKCIVKEWKTGAITQEKYMATHKRRFCCVLACH